MNKNVKIISDIIWDDFMKVEMRTGTIIEADFFEKAKHPAYKIRVDFGEFGIRKTSAQLTIVYKPADLVGKQIIAVVNFPPKQIADMMSECLILGVVGEENKVTLISPEHKVENGLRIA